MPAVGVARAHDAVLDAHFESLMECLVRVWQPPLTAVGFQIVRPSVTIYTEQISTRCGSGRMPRNAFYCPDDQKIYLSTPSATSWPRSTRARGPVTRSWLTSSATPSRAVPGSCLLQRDFYNSGDDVLSGDPNYVGDHGHGRTREFWGSTGLSTDRVGRCNTFTVPTREVR